MNNLFVLLNVLVLCVGFYCSYKLSDSRPCWVRMIVLSPVFVALYGIYVATNENYITYAHDIYEKLSLLVLYALVASRFSKAPWLDLKASDHSLCK